MHAISAEGLSKTYKSAVLRRREVRALSDFSITVQAGQIFGLLGPNGAGKTTFIKILLSLTHPSAGRAEILGRPITDVAVRHHVGYLPENHRFPQHLTGEQVLTLAGRLTGVPGPIIRMRIDNLLALVGMSQWRKVKIKKYSKGMTQRLGLAQALVNDPSLIFLDEPTDGVDPVGRKEIRDILRDLRDRGKTIFLNSHLLSEVEMVSDAVAILDKGNLLKIGTVDELTATSDQYQIGFEGSLPDTVYTELKAFIVPARVAGSLLMVDLKTVDELNRIIDLLRNNAVPITSIARQKSTLEESFISLIKRETT